MLFTIHREAASELGKTGAGLIFDREKLPIATFRFNALSPTAQSREMAYNRGHCAGLLFQDEKV